MRLQSASLEEAGGIGLLHAREVGEHLHEVAGIATTEYLVAHSLTRFGLQSTTLGKDVGDVDSEDFRPQIAVIASGIAPTPYVVEVAGAIARRNLWVQQSDLAQSLRLESSSIFGRGNILGGQHVPSKVEAGGCKVLAQGIGRLEGDALEHALLQFGRHLRTRLVMAGEVVEHLRNGCKRLVELRGHLHEIASHTGACECLIFAVGKHAMKGVTKLMEHSGYLVPRQQGRLTLRGLSRIADIEDDGQQIPAMGLLLEGIHPRSSALGGSTVVVAIERPCR